MESQYEKNPVDLGECGWFLKYAAMAEACFYPYDKEASCTQALIFRTLKTHGEQMSEEKLLRETGLGIWRGGNFCFYVYPNYDTAISKLLKRGLIEKTGHFWNRGYVITEDVKSMM